MKKLTLTVIVLGVIALGAASGLLIAHIVLQIKTTYMVTISHAEWLKADYLSDEHASYEELVKASCVKVEPAGSCDSIPYKHILIRGK